MINFPKINRITVEGYELYPGENGIGLTDISFDDGPWMVLGVNGLGKSTLLLMLRYLLVGPVRVDSAGFKGDRKAAFYGDGELTFSARVSDKARSASGTIEFSVGERKFIIKRNLKKLSFSKASVSDSEGLRHFTDETELRKKLIEAIGLAHYSDYIKLVDWVLFFLDDKAPLLWNSSAQYEIFRAVMTPAASDRMRAIEGEIISSDSAIRNVNTIISRIIKREEKELRKLDKENETRDTLDEVIKKKSKLIYEQNEALEKMNVLEEQKTDAETLFKRAEFNLENAQKEYESLKIFELQKAFSHLDKSFQYLFIKTLSEDACAFCGNECAEVEDKLKALGRNEICFFCGGENNSNSNISPETVDIELANEKVISYTEDYNEKRKSLEEAKNDLDLCRKNLYEVRSQIDVLDRKIKQLTSQLPPEDRVRLEENEDRLSQLREEIQINTEIKEKAESQIFDLTNTLKLKVEELKDNIIFNFENHAKSFFAEKIRLVYAPRFTTIGQGRGKEIPLPAFEVEMTSGATKDEFMRRKPSEVSLSQRDYIDIVFRMALIESISNSGGTLVLDGPEGSIDAVFARRAGTLLEAFSSQKSINSISACNIVDGDFIPSVLSGFATKAEREKRIINLMKIAVPTAASSQLSKEYTKKISDILQVEPEENE